MKRKILLLATILSVTLRITNAQTTITTTAQSGVWTLSGSPYIIQTNISVAAGQTLRIEPGVHVQFQQTYQFDIIGSLIANGTDPLPIYFQAVDTSGWYNDMIAAGGWHGVHFNPFQGTFDSSVFSNCIIQDVKHGTVGNWNGIEALFVYRTLKIDSCEFFHNQSSYNMAEGVTILIQGGGSFEMSHCSVHDNLNRVCALRIGTGTYEPINIHHCHFYNNSVGATIWILQSNVLFEYNEVNDNTSIYDMSAIRISGFHATLRHNTIHHNLSENEAPLTSFAGIVDIDANFICNNHHTSGSCGLVDGGGGIHVMQNDGSNWDSTRYLIRNNIIANNYSPYYGGGIYVYNTIAKVMNNHIVNNSAHYGGAGIFALGVQTDLYLQNNLIYGNCHDFGQLGDVQLGDIHLFTYRNNWVEYSFTTNVIGTATIISGDTTHNVIGADPFMINPTSSCSYLDSALNSDFNVQVNSGCIDNGDSTGSVHTLHDYLANYRMMGASIDIGAFEHPGEIINGTTTIAGNNFIVYPNPAVCQLAVESHMAVALLRQAQHDNSIIILDALGREVLHFEMTDAKTLLDIHSLTNGIYFIEIISSNGIERTKFIVQK